MKLINFTSGAFYWSTETFMTFYYIHLYIRKHYIDRIVFVYKDRDLLLAIACLLHIVARVLNIYFAVILSIYS